MTAGSEPIRARIAQQAGDWFIANRSGPLAEPDRVAFVSWLKASPIHIEEYLGIAVIARDLPAAADDPDLAMETLLASARSDESDSVVSFAQLTTTHEARVKPFWVSRAWPVAASVTTVMIVAIASLLWWSRDGELLGLPRTYQTAHGEQSAWRLPDGSTLHLNTDSEASVRYSRRERVVDLERGQALFEVASDSKRRFRVTADQAQVIAIGTQFDVYRKPDGAAVITVIDGTVGVLAGNPMPLTQAEVLPAEALRVGPGHQVRVEAGIMPGRAVPVNLQQAMAWLQHKIAFEQQPLGEVADEFNRYARVPFEITDPTLRALPISGVFDAYDTDSFAAFLETLDGVAVQRTATQIRVHFLSPATQETPASPLTRPGGG